MDKHEKALFCQQLLPSFGKNLSLDRLIALKKPGLASIFQTFSLQHYINIDQIYDKTLAIHNGLLLSKSKVNYSLKIRLCFVFHIALQRLGREGRRLSCIYMYIEAVSFPWDV